MGDRKEPKLYDGSPKPPPPPAPPAPRESWRDKEFQGTRQAKLIAKMTAEVGDDEITKREKAMGLDIDPKTGRAYESQGDFHNLGIGAGGKFYNGAAVPRVAQCSACGGRIAEDSWGRGFQNCGALDFCGQFFLCPECCLRVLNLFPRIKAMVKAMHGGDLTRG